MATGRKSGSTGKAGGTDRSGGSGGKSRQSASARGKKPPEATIIEPPKKAAKAGSDDQAPVVEGRARDVTPPAEDRSAPEPPKSATGKPSNGPEATRTKAAPAGDPKPKPEAGREATTPASESPASTGSSRGTAGVILAVLVAGLLGGGAGWLAATRLTPPPPDRGPEIAALRDSQAVLKAQLEQRLAALDSRLAALEEAAQRPAAEKLRSELEALRRELEGQIAALADRLGLDEQRLDKALKALDDTRRRIEASLAEGGGQISRATAELIARYGAEIDALKAELNRQADTARALQTRLDTLASAAGDRLKQAQDRAADLSRKLAEQARGLDLQVARDRLRAAIETGRPYAEELARIASEAAIDIPRALRDGAETGVPPLIQLRAEYPDAARRALKAALKAQARAGDGLTGRIAAFLKAQIGVRSLAERPGDDPDALLSQAEAALKRGDLKTAVERLRRLPPEALAEMQPWLDGAERRLAVEQALEQLAPAPEPGPAPAAGE